MPSHTGSRSSAAQRGCRRGRQYTGCVRPPAAGWRRLAALRTSLPPSAATRACGRSSATPRRRIRPAWHGRGSRPLREQKLPNLDDRFGNSGSKPLKYHGQKFDVAVEAKILRLRKIKGLCFQPALCVRFGSKGFFGAVPNPRSLLPFSRRPKMKAPAMACGHLQRGNNLQEAAHPTLPRARPGGTRRSMGSFACHVAPLPHKRRCPSPGAFERAVDDHLKARESVQGCQGVGDASCASGSRGAHSPS